MPFGKLVVLVCSEKLLRQLNVRTPLWETLTEMSIDISIQKKINKQLAIDTSFTDIFGTKRIVYENRTDNFRIVEDLRFQFQRIKFSLIYKLKD